MNKLKIFIGMLFTESVSAGMVPDTIADLMGRIQLPMAQYLPVGPQHHDGNNYMLPVHGDII